ncbi:Major facilitator superfamily domain, general substrate transporter [Penicillium expansum]|uniref:Major facilitator superfamily domain, general substrate transporter n=1 Tax=Penicillium expansum TaxID=27334 RepID=A0A0A2JS28_PENEN|nr:Major facilitator superfamily domain, general substrate transporter [Penicillium expansum]KGO58217.1 Major facilitator superfamily domain, general substrate transporter [Penicillium expansum]
MGAPDTPGPSDEAIQHDLDQARVNQETVDLERLGRERPKCFTGAWSEISFCLSIFMSQILAEYYISGSNVLLPTLVKELDLPEASTIWPSTALSLVVTSTLLIFGRLTDMFGGYLIYSGGAIWLTISSILCGVSQTWLMLIICRALQGFALAAFLPSGIMVLGSTYRPGPRKNIVFSIYGACAALGFFVGIFFSGLSGEYLTWRWYFFFGAILSAITAALSLFSIPRDYSEKRKLGIQMDWPGACLFIPAAVLIVFAIADSSYAPQGWRTPYIPLFFVLGLILLGVMIYVEGWVVKNPLLPGDVFRVKYMLPLVIALLFLYGTLGIFLLYAVLYMSDIMGASPMQIVAWAVPMAVGGLILSVGGGMIFHKVPGTILMLISCLGYVGSGLFFAVIPIGGNYWAFVFPAMICGTVGIDISFNLANVFITTNLPKSRQGLAGALINCTLHMGIAVMLGFADIVQTQTSELGTRDSYKAVFWYQTGLAILGMLIVLFFVRIREAKSEFTLDEREAMAAEGNERAIEV